jgi:Spy/CpxP family protein refolding chaperone
MRSKLYETPIDGIAGKWADYKGVRAAVLSLNLSAVQRLQVSNLLQTTRSQLATSLTPEQQQKVQQNAQTSQQQSD